MKAVQLRMARAAMGWGVRELAEKAGVTANTVTRIELGADAKQSTIDALQRVLEAAGVEFINGDAPGVRLRPGAKPPAIGRKKAKPKPVAKSRRQNGSPQAHRLALAAVGNTRYLGVAGRP
jgi:transcriptional regulator with XRE-family HTH domain